MRTPKILLALAGVVMVAGTTVASASPAMAAASISSVTLSRITPLIIDGDWGCGDRMTVTVVVNEPANQWSTYTNVSAKVTDKNGSDRDFLLMTKGATSGTRTSYRDKVNICGFDSPGQYTITTEVSWYDGHNFRSQEQTNIFSVKRPTGLDYNASPEPAKRGAKLTHSGQLSYDALGYGPMYGAPGQKLILSFRQAGSSTFVVKGTITTGTGGRFKATLKTYADGTWRLSLPDSTYRQPQAKEDFVRTIN